MCARCVILLLRSHHAQIVTTRSLLDEIAEMQRILLTHVSKYRELVGTNIAGLKYIQAVKEQRQQSFFSGEEQLERESNAAAGVVDSTAALALPVSIPPAQTNKGKKKLKKI